MPFVRWWITVHTVPVKMVSVAMHLCDAIKFQLQHVSITNVVFVLTRQRRKKCFQYYHVESIMQFWSLIHKLKPRWKMEIKTNETFQFSTGKRWNCKPLCSKSMRKLCTMQRSKRLCCLPMPTKLLRFTSILSPRVFNQFRLSKYQTLCKRTLHWSMPGFMWPKLRL